MDGTIPTEIGLLEKLHTLSLLNISLGGTLPTEIGLLSELGELIARVCYLELELAT